MFDAPYFKNLALLLGVALMFVPITTQSLWSFEAVNSAHTVIFIFISGFLYHFLRSRLPHLNHYYIYLCTIALGMIFGALIEMLQFFIGRQMSGQDLTKDFFGLVSGLGLVVVFEQIKTRSYGKTAMLALLIFISFFILGISSLLQLSWHYYQRHSAFPVLVDFDKSWSRSFVRFNQAEIISEKLGHRSAGNDLHRLVFKPGKYPGVSVIETEADWSGYRYLRFELFSRYFEELAVTLRVHDSSHTQEYSDRYNKRLFVQHGLNEITIKLSDIQKAPANRELKLAKIAGLQLFAVDLEKEFELEISSIKLQ